MSSILTSSAAAILRAAVQQGQSSMRTGSTGAPAAGVGAAWAADAGAAGAGGQQGAGVTHKTAIAPD